MFQGRVGAGCTGDPRRQARQARWAWVAEGIRLLPVEFTGNVPREGRSRLHRRPAPLGAAGPLGLGRRRDSAPTLPWRAALTSPWVGVGGIGGVLARCGWWAGRFDARTWMLREDRNEEKAP